MERNWDLFGILIKLTDWLRFVSFIWSCTSSWLEEKIILTRVKIFRAFSAARASTLTSHPSVKGVVSEMISMRRMVYSKHMHNIHIHILYSAEIISVLSSEKPFVCGTKKVEYKCRQWHDTCFHCKVCKTKVRLFTTLAKVKMKMSRFTDKSKNNLLDP